MFNLDEYQSVDERITQFWNKYPDGRLSVEIVELTRNEMGQAVQVVMKASAWKNINDAHPSAVDFAEETLGSNPVNRTSFIENCSTSVLGRVLATLNFSPKKQNGEAANLRPSRQEMEKASRIEGKTTEGNTQRKDFTDPTPAQLNAITKRAAACGVPTQEMLRFWNLLLNRPADTRVSKLDASKLMDLDREAWEATAIQNEWWPA